MGTLRAAAPWIIAAIFSGCGGSNTDALLGSSGGSVDAGALPICTPGKERCPCYGNGTCDAGLGCASDLCVKLPAGTGPGSVSKDSGVPDASAGGAGAVGGAGRPAAGGATPGGRSGSGGVLSSGGRAPMGGFAGRGGASTVGNGGSFAGAGGRSGAGGIPISGGSASDAGACILGQKSCDGVCAPPTPQTGCALTGCTSCALAAPANGYLLCANEECAFDCLSGFTKRAGGCHTTNGVDAGGGAVCDPATCPQNCSVTFGPACCTADGRCGCPAIPYMATTCIAS
jgi:hypothetical protein